MNNLDGQKSEPVSINIINSKSKLNKERVKNSDKVKVGLVNINVSFDNQNYFPYSLGLLQSYTIGHLSDSDRFEFQAPLYKRKEFNQCIEQLIDSNIIFFSHSIWNSVLNSKIAERIKQINPETIIVFGGNSIPPPRRIDSFLTEKSFIDLAGHDEGEITFTAILENYNNRNWPKVPSVSFRENGHIITTPMAQRITSLDEIPSPYLEGIFNKLMDENPEEGWIGLWETNRGCPYTCSYCQWGGEVGKKVTQYKLETLIEEIDWFSKHKVEFVRCCDANFGILPRDIELVRRFAENKEKYGYPHALSVENAKNATKTTFEVQMILNNSGLNKGVNLAVQSLHEPVLEAMKRKNISNEGYRELQHRFTKEGVPTFSDMIIGLPEESYYTFVEGVVKLIEGGQHNSISFYNALILPNAEMGDPDFQKKYGIITRQIRQISGYQAIDNEPIQELEEIIISTNTMTPEDWRRIKTFAWTTALIYHEKLLQIPFIIAHNIYERNYRDIFESFCRPDQKNSPVLADINNFFMNKARTMQEEGSSNNCALEEGLNMWWPADQFKLIELFMNDKLATFYDESRKVFRQIIGEDSLLIEDALTLSNLLLKRPYQNEDLSVKLRHNIWEFYRGALVGESVELQKGEFRYQIDRTSEKFDSWEDWCRDVVWWKHKRGEYLYPCKRSPD